jgi:hypothetical protein
MPSFLSSLPTTVLTLFACVGMASNTEPRFGIYFSATTITASRFNSSDSLELMKFPASAEYQTYYRDAVQNFGVANHGTNNADFDSIITNTMRPLTEALENQTGHVPEFSALILPSVFKIGARRAARRFHRHLPQHRVHQESEPDSGCSMLGLWLHRRQKPRTSTERMH